MRTLRAALSAVLLFAAGCASVTQQPLRVMTYNIHAGKDAKGIENLERVAALITSSNADVVLLQEVDRGTTRSGNVDQLEVLMRLTNMHGAFGKSLDYQGGLYGIATLSRWPIVRQQTIPLSVTPPQERAGGSREPRVALMIETGAGRRSIVVFNTHLDASGEDRYRMQEVAQLLPAISTTAASIVGGDFNAEPDSAVHGEFLRSGLTDSWAACASGPGLTYPAATPRKRIDYVFLAPGIRCAAAKVIETEVSDHRPVVVELSY